MKKTVCDFCGKNVTKGGIQFVYQRKHYRVDISVFTESCRIRASRTDACAACTFKYAIIAAKAILKEAEEQRELKRKAEIQRRKFKLTKVQRLTKTGGRNEKKLQKSH